MITRMTIQKIDKDLKKPGLVWSSTGVPISASSLGSAGADALDDGFFGAIQWQDYARDTCQDSCAGARHVPPKVTRKNSGPVFIKKILSQPLFRGPSALTHSTTGLQSGCAATTQDSHVKHA